VLSDGVDGHVVETTLAALCAIEAWWEGVKASMKDAVSDSFDVLLLRRKDCPM
jgi:hypothetical protein